MIKVWVGLLSIVVLLGNGILIARQRRRSGPARERRHSLKDDIFLLGSALVVILAMFIVFRWIEPGRATSSLPARYLVEAAILAVAAGVTYLSNYFLNRH
jgi:hypothetical protein